MPDTYDLVVIGSGVAGQTVAQTCRTAGWSVAVVDDRPFGGTCAQRGCDPKKVLVHAAHVWEEAAQRRGTGLAGDLRIDWGDLMRFKRTFTDPVPDQTRGRFDEAGIDTVRGHARFSGERQLTVETGEGTRRVDFAHCVIAAGARPVSLPLSGTEHFSYSYDFLEWDALPARIVFVGGGYISCEFAHLAARAGAEDVHILQRGPRLLKGFAPETVDVVQRATEDLGIQVHLNHDVQAIERRGDVYRVAAEAEGRTVHFDADAVVHGAGRVPPLDALNLEAAGIEREGRGLALTDYLQSTSNPVVYAAGDAAGVSKALTPTATLEGEAVAHNLLHGNEQIPDRYAVPTVAFTTPRIARVGRTVAEAEDEGFDFTIHRGDASDWYTARMHGTSYARYKVLVDNGTGCILGAHLVYPGAADLVNLFALAMRHDLTADDLMQMPYTYPTSGWDVRYMLG